MRDKKLKLTKFTEIGDSVDFRKDALRHWAVVRGLAIVHVILCLLEYEFQETNDRL